MSLTVTIASGVLGAVAGGMAPRIAYRLSVPLGSPPRSACAACDAPFSPGLRGWVRLGSACPRCGARSGATVWVSALAGLTVCGGLAWAVPRSPLLPVLLLAGAVGVLLSLIDVACLRLPDLIVLPLLGVSAASVAAASIATGSDAQFVRGLIAAVALAGFYLVAGFVVPSGVGLGDVKLALVLGLLLGWFGWGFVLAGAVVAHIIHGLTAASMWIARRADRKTLLPMGPALLAGAWFAIAVIPAILTGIGN